MLNTMFVLQLAQSVIELNNQIQLKDKEIQSNEAKSVSVCACVTCSRSNNSNSNLNVVFMCLRMLEYQQQIGSLEGDCRDLRSCLQVGDTAPT